jgi:hypothetical protein
MEQEPRLDFIVFLILSIAILLSAEYLPPAPVGYRSYITQENTP